MTSDSNIQYVLSLSYGKDSLACLEAIRLLGLPLDRIVHAEVWATDIIPADLPPMVEFKKKADKIIKERYGIEVEHIYAMKNGEKLTYEKIFYCVPKRRERERERERTHRRIPDNVAPALQLKTQTESDIGFDTVFREEQCRSAKVDSKRVFSTNIYGFPIIHGIWCNAQLKKRVFLLPR